MKLMTSNIASPATFRTRSTIAVPIRLRDSMPCSAAKKLAAQAAGLAEP